MSALDIGSLLFGVLGLLFGVRCYFELWKWARQCQGARIAVAYKRRVQLQAPLIEWLGWINQLDKDKASTGRVVYRNHGVSVAIMRRPKGASRFPRLRRRSKTATPDARAA